MSGSVWDLLVPIKKQLLPLGQKNRLPGYPTFYPKYYTLHLLPLRVDLAATINLLARNLTPGQLIHWSYAKNGKD